MRLETFSYLPPLTPQEQTAQIAALLARGLTPAIEYTKRSLPRDHYWNLWKLPLFDARSPGDVTVEIEACATANPHAYIKIIGYNPKTQGQVAFVVRRPPDDEQPIS